MLGMPRETVSRAFQKLIKERLIEYEKKKIVIYNVNAIICFYREESRNVTCDRCAKESKNDCFFKR
jgi:DNA-binding transcriptional regulator YhcF (GntR family)